MPPTSKPIATERKSFTSMIQASLIRKLDEAYHELSGHTAYTLHPPRELAVEGSSLSLERQNATACASIG